MQLTEIGTIHTPYKEIADMPIQPSGAEGVAGEIDLHPDLVAGLKDLDGFSHLILIYHFHRVTRSNLTVVPFLDPQPRGVFATRAPTRPNPIGLSVVRLSKITGHRLLIEGVDMLDGTPLLDIKPYVPAFDGPNKVRTGWLENSGPDAVTHRSDTRFA